jgi:hypothetical protein
VRSLEPHRRFESCVRREPSIRSHESRSTREQIRIQPEPESEQGPGGGVEGRVGSVVVDERLPQSLDRGLQITAQRGASRGIRGGMPT